MGVIHQGILGGFHGKTGSVVGSSWRGIQVIRGLPKRIKRKASAKQLVQRQKFHYVSKTLKQLDSLLNFGFPDRPLSRSTNYAEAVQHLLLAGLSGQFPSFRVNFSNFSISEGPLRTLGNLKWERSGAKKVKLIWEHRPFIGRNDEEDGLVIVLYHIGKNRFEFYQGGKRKDESFEIDVPTDMQNASISGWAFVRDEATDVNSDSMYLADLEPFTAPKTV
ncbi:hypothetical protein GCM10022216_32010 [Sphingobacterium kyonggiense]|uniref:Uncharacterized protein n=1 Tax=Sphingobacterium kyonggiense TaxID=714075 RepID=A0ABP7Z707_9SPHI